MSNFLPSLIFRGETGSLKPSDLSMPRKHHEYKTTALQQKPACDVAESHCRYGNAKTSFPQR